jgi:hypothetical protein
MSTNKSKRTKTKDVRLSNPIATFFHCEKCCEEECEYPGDKSVGYAEFQRDSGNERRRFDAVLDRRGLHVTLKELKSS